MPTKQYNTPILFLIFKREQSSLCVLNEIRKAKPTHLYIAADGPREDNNDDIINCEKTRKAVLKAIDWECEVKTLFRDINRGCGYGPAEAITWFFNQVEYGIILEDDIIPSQSFFSFCEELLIKYKDDDKIMSIAGTNFVSQIFKSAESYYFTNYAGGWGWASWKRAWKHYDYNISSWEKPQTKKKIREKFSAAGYAFWEEAFDLVCNKNIDHIWDYQWVFCKMVNDGIGIIPSKNLTTNIGFGEDATHTFEASEDIIKANINEEILFPLIHPQQIVINNDFDKFISEKFFSKTPKQKFQTNQFNIIYQKKTFLKNIIKKIYWKIFHIN
ncbi:nucleotide-diphospho-sugar transferase [Chryseobacterium sp. RLHN22]|uniref:nucleotide-diphospho-sugar transferase n=1 Tax=Chryseobacterium sp. RLHN22 TaxID=3437885 RepID=UPI003D9ADD88